MDITEKQFLRYEEVRKSGKTNMIHVGNVIRIAGLRYDECMEIMKNYSLYKLKYIDKVIKWISKSIKDPEEQLVKSAIT